jgi:hypothetical protein
VLPASALAGALAGLSDEALAPLLQYMPAGQRRARHVREQFSVPSAFKSAVVDLAEVMEEAADGGAAERRRFDGVMASLGLGTAGTGAGTGSGADARSAFMRFVDSIKADVAAEKAGTRKVELGENDESANGAASK